MFYCYIRFWRNYSRSCDYSPFRSLAWSLSDCGILLKVSRQKTRSRGGRAMAQGCPPTSDINSLPTFHPGNRFGDIFKHSHRRPWYDWTPNAQNCVSLINSTSPLLILDCPNKLLVPKSLFHDLLLVEWKLFKFIQMDRNNESYHSNKPLNIHMSVDCGPGS